MRFRDVVDDLACTASLPGQAWLPYRMASRLPRAAWRVEVEIKAQDSNVTAPVVDGESALREKADRGSCSALQPGSPGVSKWELETGWGHELVGRRVELCSLRLAREHLNGKVGIAESYVDASNRYMVRLGSGELLALRRSQFVCYRQSMAAWPPPRLVLPGLRPTWLQDNLEENVLTEGLCEETQSAAKGFDERHCKRTSRAQSALLKLTADRSSQARHDSRPSPSPVPRHSPWS